ncbi:MAG: LacI family DNA-binding transcriptional regulator [Anaerolineae bacterium]
MPTLQDVAKYAGVSTATVSKVLSNTPYFSETTRDKVLEAVAALGYRPNMAARALSSGKTNIIAVVFPFIYDAIFKDPLVMRVLEGIEAVCTEEGYNILLSTPRLKDTKPEDHYLRLIQGGYIEGLIAIDNVPAVSFSQLAEACQVASIVLGHHEGDYRVQSDNFHGGTLLMKAVLSHGHQKIGMISVPAEMNIAIQQRLAGLLEVYKHTNLPFEIPIIESDFSSQGGANAARKLLEQEPELSAIIALNDRMAIGAMSAVQQMGISIPEQLSVVGYDDIPIASTTRPALTTINQTPVELGRAAAELLLARLNQASKPSNVVLRPQLVMRESLATRR